jgi:quercetin dioxygenase-like cupin family protein
MTNLLTPFARQRALDDRTTWYMGHLFTYLVTGEETAGQFSLIEATIRRGLEPPPHFHTREDELFYILSGEMIFTVGDEVITATPGMTVFLPREVPHGFRLLTEEAHVLILCTPAGLERYFQEFSEPAQGLTLPPVEGNHFDISRLIAAGQQYGIEFLPPA